MIGGIRVPVVVFTVRIQVKHSANPMHFGDSTSCSSLKGEDDWWDLATGRELV